MLLFQTSANTCFLFLFFLTLVITTFKFAYVASNVLCIRIHMSVPDLVLPCKETPVGGGICWKKQTFSRLHLTCAFCVDVDMCVWCVWTAGPPSFFPLFLFPSFSLSTINSGFYGNKRFSGTALKREKEFPFFIAEDFSVEHCFLWPVLGKFFMFHVDRRERRRRSDNVPFSSKNPVQGPTKPSSIQCRHL